MSLITRVCTRAKFGLSLVELWTVTLNPVNHFDMCVCVWLKYYQARFQTQKSANPIMIVILNLKFNTQFIAVYFDRGASVYSAHSVSYLDRRRTLTHHRPTV